MVVEFRVILTLIILEMVSFLLLSWLILLHLQYLHRWPRGGFLGCCKSCLCKCCLLQVLFVASHAVASATLFVDNF
ncbi:hypothetical protein L1987_14693 [Smallanthus sonchifolius]|uniref:Uncharacterized protein n=1 Tax=Smallanthus sonchifolius TaxID=185202 RepID=A0ACB9J5R1_9ASTR|nr:hypothetical protein L1987_14693 [Smallanthus sonchifolius]